MLISAIGMFCQLFKININNLSREEKIILETELFSRLYDELNENTMWLDHEQSSAIKFYGMESEMTEGSLIRNLIKDILVSQEYSLSGIAYYTHTPEDVIYEIALGRNDNPSISLARKIISLHRHVRPHLYEEIIKKILCGYLDLGKDKNDAK